MKYLDKPKVFTLDNGLRVALLETGTPKTFAKLVVNFGAYHEEQGEEGLAHLLEHCMYGGNIKYSESESKKIRGRFGCSNATTSLVDTSYYADIFSEDLGLWLDFTSNQIAHPIFNRKKLASEKDIVLREKVDRESRQNYTAIQEINDLFFHNHPLNIETIGNEQSIIRARTSDLQRIHEKGYNATNTELYLVGHFPKNVESLIKKYFEKIKPGKNTKVRLPEVEPLQKKTILHRPYGEINLQNPELSSAEISFHFSGPTTNSPDNFSTSFALHTLGGDEESKLFRRLREKEGLAYAVDCEDRSDRVSGIMAVYTKVPSGNVNKAVQIIFEEMEKIKSRKVNSESIEKMKRKIKLGILSNLERNIEKMKAVEAIVNTGWTIEKFLGRAESITPASVQEAARKYFPTSEGNYILYVGDPLLKLEGLK